MTKTKIPGDSYFDTKTRESRTSHINLCHEEPAKGEEEQNKQYTNKIKMHGRSRCAFNWIFQRTLRNVEPARPPSLAANEANVKYQFLFWMQNTLCGARKTVRIKLIHTPRRRGENENVSVQMGALT